MCFFKVKHYFGHISGMVGPINVKRKGSALVGYWMQYVTLTFDLSHDLDLGCFKVKFRNSSISEIVGLIDVKWKGSELIWHWTNCMTLPSDHTHDFDLGVLRSESEIALSQEWGGRLTMNEKDVSHPFMTMMFDLWADVPDSDRGDFRRRRAVDISSWFRYWLVAWSAPSHYLNQCWNIINSNPRNKLQWNLKWTSYILIKKMHLKMSSAR